MPESQVSLPARGLAQQAWAGSYPEKTCEWEWGSWQVREAAVNK